MPSLPSTDSPQQYPVPTATSSGALMGVQPAVAPHATLTTTGGSTATAGSTAQAQQINPGATHTEVLDQMQEQFETLQRAFFTLKGCCEFEIKRIKEEKLQLSLRDAATAQKLTQLHTSAERRVRLNVGGRRFEVGEATLLRYPGSIFEVMLGGNFNVDKDENGYIFIDRSPELFEEILHFLRTGDIQTLPRSNFQAIRLQQEAHFYGFHQLSMELEAEHCKWKHETGNQTVEGDVPSARCFASCQYVGDNTLYLFGGCTADDVFFDSFYSVNVVPVMDDPTLDGIDTLEANPTSNTSAGSGAATSAEVGAGQPGAPSQAVASMLERRERFVFRAVTPTFGRPPAARSGHTLTHIDGHLILIYGNNSSSMMSDIHAFNIAGNGWTQLTQKGDTVSPRSGHTVSVVRNKLYLIGGKQIFPVMMSFSSVYEGTFFPDRGEIVWTKIESRGEDVKKRAYHTAAVHNNIIYVYGGIVNDVYSRDLCSYDASSHVWRLFTTGNPRLYTPTVSRSGHVAVVHNDQMIVFGSYSEESPDLALYSLDLKTFVWRRMETKGKAPGKRAAPSGTVIPSDPRRPKLPVIFVFGGFDIAARKCFNDVYTFTL